MFYLVRITVSLIIWSYLLITIFAILFFIGAMVDWLDRALQRLLEWFESIWCLSIKYQFRIFTKLIFSFINKRINKVQVYFLLYPQLHERT